jgi:CheY-like chemotaxis protein
MKRLLLVDDNDRYAELLAEYFEGYGYTIERARNAREGLELYLNHNKDFYDVIVSDITMESQLAGYSMIKKIFRTDYRGTVVFASTGFDVTFGMLISRYLFKKYGVDYLVPKTTVIDRSPVFYRLNGSGEKLKQFVEIPKG